MQFFLTHKTVDRTLSISAGNTVTLRTRNPAQFATGTFTADATTQAITFDANTGSQFLNAYQLRELPTPATVQEFKIDIDSRTGGSIATQPGWTSIDATESSNGDNAIVDGVTFTVFSADGSRSRTSGGVANPGGLTTDFVYDDGNGQAVGLRVDDLPDGIWEAKVWSWDQTAPAGGQIVGITRFITGSGNETIYATNFAPHPNDPFTFQFDSSLLPDTGFGIFTRESAISGNNRARFNALQLTLVPQTVIPEPMTMLAVGLGVAGLGRYVRRRRKDTSRRRITMKTTKTLAVLLAVGLFLAGAGVAHAATVLNPGGDVSNAGGWDNGKPSSSNPGTIAVDGINTDTTFGYGAGAVITHTAGSIVANDGFNMVNSGTWNMSGGKIAARYILSNGSNTFFNFSGGVAELADRSGTQHMGVANNGTLNISGSAVLDGTHATVGVQTGGSVDIASGWTGSWTWGTYSGNDWKNLFTGNLIEVDGSNIDGATFDSTFVVTDGGQTLSMQSGSPPASAGYVGTINGQSPFEYYRLDTLNGENGGTLVQNTVTINQTTPSPTLDPAGGFPGLDGNSWGNFPGDPGSTLTEEDGGWSSQAGSVSLWVRQATSGGGSTRTLVFAHQAGQTGTFNGGTNQALGIFTRTNGSWGIMLDNVSNDTGALSPLPLDEWHHLAFTWDRSAGVTRTYFDGGLVKSVTGTWDAFTMNNDGRFGKEINGGTRVFAGSMDEIAIWSRALSDTEIRAQYDAAFAAPIPEPMTMLAVGLAVAGLGGYVKRRKQL